MYALSCIWMYYVYYTGTQVFGSEFPVVGL